MSIDHQKIFQRRAQQATNVRGGPAGRKFTISPEPRLADAIQALADRSGVTADVVIEQACWQNPQIRLAAKL
jgi:hypothetical protein